MQQLNAPFDGLTMLFRIPMLTAALFVGLLLARGGPNGAVMAAPKPQFVGTEREAAYGMVVDSETKRPLAGAAVSLHQQPDRSRPSHPSGGTLRLRSYSTQTQHDGSFEFGGVLPGVYAVAAELHGYLDSGRWSAPDTLEIKRRATPSNIVVELQPASTVEGIVADPDGQGLKGANVTAIASFGEGLQTFATTKATDSGRFTFSHLPPGQYLLRASPPAFQSMAPTYFPSASSIDGAFPISVRLGQRVSEVRIRLLSAPAYRVSGIIDDWKGVLSGGHTDVYLIPQTSKAVDAAAIAHRSPVAADRSFEFVEIPAGSFVLQVLHGTSPGRVVATQPIVVGSSDLHRIVIRTRSAIELTGIVKPDGRSAQDLSMVRIVFRGLRTPIGYAASIDALPSEEGDFVVRDLEPVRYLLDLETSTGLYVERITFAGRPLHDGILDLANGSHGRLQVTVSDGGARISGSALHRAGDGSSVKQRPVAIIYPAHLGVRSSWLRVAPVIGDRFEFSGLRPGTYEVLATERFAPGLFGVPAFKSQVSASIRTVRLRRHDRQRIDLDLIDTLQVSQAAQRVGAMEH